MKKIYIAAPLFNDMELERNKEFSNLFKNWGYSIYLPQEEAGLSARQINNNNKKAVNDKIFNKDLQGIKDSDILVFFLDGRIPDEGACVELGIAYALGKICIGYKTDDRNLDFTGDDNLFIESCMNYNIAHNIDELKTLLQNSVAKNDFNNN